MTLYARVLIVRAPDALLYSCSRKNKSIATSRVNWRMRGERNDRSIVDEGNSHAGVRE
jgi:hypothetical protein